MSYLEGLPKKFRSIIDRKKHYFSLYGLHGIYGTDSEVRVLDGHISQYIGCLDRNGKDIYVDDLLRDEQGYLFRIYELAGGFAIKASVWKYNLNDLTPSDELILLPCAQSIAYFKESCEVVGNIYQNRELLKKTSDEHN